MQWTCTAQFTAVLIHHSDCSNKTSQVGPERMVVGSSRTTVKKKSPGERTFCNALVLQPLQQYQSLLPSEFSLTPKGREIQARRAIADHSIPFNGVHSAIVGNGDTNHGGSTRLQ
jgi:hypothetical protein